MYSDNKELAEILHHTKENMAQMIVNFLKSKYGKNDEEITMFCTLIIKNSPLAHFFEMEFFLWCHAISINLSLR